MPTLEPMLYISPETLAGVRAGRLVVEGSVVRAAANGRIVEHLHEVDKLPRKEALRMARAALSKVKTPQGAAVASGGAVVAAVGTGAAWRLTRPQREARKLEKRLNQALVAYLEAAAQGTLSGELVQDAIDAITAVEDHPRRDELPSLTRLGIDQVAGDISRYSRQLSHAPAPLGPSDDVTDLPGLRHHLELQKAIAASSEVVRELSPR